MIFLTVIGPVISYKMPNLKFSQELAFGSELSTRYNLLRIIRHMTSLQLVCCQIFIVSEIMKMLIYYCVS